jgi:hypothetical protein
MAGSLTTTFPSGFQAGDFLAWSKIFPAEGVGVWGEKSK